MATEDCGSPRPPLHKRRDRCFLLYPTASSSWIFAGGKYDAAMKPTLALVPLLGALLAGCGEQSGAAAKSNPAAAPADYVKSAAKSQQRAIKTVDTAALNKAIELFYVQEGRFPKDLDELVEKKFIPEIPPAPTGTKIVYDAKAGIVQIEKE